MLAGARDDGMAMRKAAILLAGYSFKNAIHPSIMHKQCRYAKENFVLRRRVAASVVSI